MLRTSENLLRNFESARVTHLAERLLSAYPAFRSLDVARHYLDEAIRAGIETDLDIAEFAMLLHQVDQTGRSMKIDDIVRNPASTGALKVFQLYYALHGERP